MTIDKTTLKRTLWAATFGVGLLAGLIMVFSPTVSADPPGQIVGEVQGSRRLQRNAVVYISQMPGNQRPASRPIEMDQRDHEFQPRVLPIVRGSTVRFLNNDAEAHNVFSPDQERYDLGNWTGGEHRDHTFNTLGAYTQLCRLHPSMIGYVLVLQNRYFDRTNSRGLFRIRNVPPGTYQLEVWQERGRGGPVEVTVTSGETTEVQMPIQRGRS